MSIKCAPEWPVRDETHKEHLKLALQILQERNHKGESAAAILKTAGRKRDSSSRP
jgi:hypothetical protein